MKQRQNTRVASTGRPWRALGVALVLGLGPATAGLAVEVPPEGQCPPYPVTPGQATTPEGDALPPLFTPGEHLEFGDLGRLRNYLPPEVWQRRSIFFYEGMRITVGRCHRRYPTPEFFRQATRANAARTRLDPAGNLLGYSGGGLPFPPQQIADDAPEAGWKWAWNHRYRYQGSGFRGKFRIIHMIRRGRKTERFEGNFFLLPLHGYPGASQRNSDDRFWAGGSFEKPAISRGIAWRQLRKAEVDRKFQRSDDVWVWLPDARRVRRAPQFSVEGLFMPTYTRGQQSLGGQLNVPDQTISTPDASIGITEHQRRGFVGLVIRPNAYRFHFVRTQDVLAPINSDSLGYPLNPDLSYGPSGLSVANGRWELRRAVVLRGTRKETLGKIGSLTLYIDALTQAPLYWITRRPNELVKEVGIFMGRFTADDGLAPRWQGSGEGFGTLLPVAQTFFVAGEEGWLRESFELRSDPPTDKERRHFTSTIRLQRGH